MLKMRLNYLTPESVGRVFQNLVSTQYTGRNPKGNGIENRILLVKINVESAQDFEFSQNVK